MVLVKDRDRVRARDKDRIRIRVKGKDLEEGKAPGKAQFARNI